jgi:hypothetical protein
MKNSVTARGSEDAIERVLAGLRDVEAPAGMERRILEGLEGGVLPVEARSDWRRFVPVWVTMPVGSRARKTLVCGVALAGVVVVAFGISAIWRIGRVRVQSKIGVVSVEPVSRTPAVATTSDSASSSVRSSRRFEMPANVPGAEAVRADDSDKDAVAVSEMQAASFPAPPMPLTEQERLLLRLVHKVDPVEMAMLDPKFRAMQEAEEKAEFQRFFGQSTKQAAPAQQGTADQAVTQQSPTDRAAPAPDQAAPAQALPAQPGADPGTQDLSNQKQAVPETSSPDQSMTQQPTPRLTGTGENE